jgi:excisionase family DNA binding protein
METARPVERLERLVTVREAALLLGIGRHLLYRAAGLGELSLYNPGGWSRVRLSDVAAWLERTRRLPRSER